MIKSKIRKYHAPVWDEPLVMQMGQRGRRGSIAPVTEPKIVETVGRASDVRRGERGKALEQTHYCVSECASCLPVIGNRLVRRIRETHNACPTVFASEHH